MITHTLKGVAGQESQTRCREGGVLPGPRYFFDLHITWCCWAKIGKMMAPEVPRTCPTKSLVLEYDWSRPPVCPELPSTYQHRYPHLFPFYYCFTYFILHFLVTFTPILLLYILYLSVQLTLSCFSCTRLRVGLTIYIPYLYHYLLSF